MKLKEFFNRKNLFLTLNLALTILIWVGDSLFMNTGALLAKGLTSAVFVIMGSVNLVYLILNKNKDYRFPAILLTGLVFAMLGDIILNIKGGFIYGAALFAVGHVFFFVAYCFSQKLLWTDLIYGVVILVPSVLFITLAPIFDFGGVMMEIVCVVYAIIISLMVGKAVANFVRDKNWKSLIIMVGSILFFFSDLMLLIDVFANISRIFDVLCLATYYPAEALLAFSIFIHNYENKLSKVSEEVLDSKDEQTSQE